MQLFVLYVILEQNIDRDTGQFKDDKMSTCTFFGHRDTPDEIEPILYSVLKDLIEKHNVKSFYVGNQGSFDIMVRRNLKKLKSYYPHIDYAVVLAYLPIKNDNNYDFSDTLIPDELETIHPKYAIAKRNQWMLDEADYVVTYVKVDFGGAAKFKKIAERKGKVVINLEDK